MIDVLSVQSQAVYAKLLANPNTGAGREVVSDSDWPLRLAKDNDWLRGKFENSLLLQIHSY